MKKIISFCIIGIIALLSASTLALADTEADAAKRRAENSEIKLLAPIGEKDAVPIPDYDPEQGGYSIRIIETYLQFWYPYAAMLLVSITVLMTVVGSIEIITAAGDSAKVTSGKERIMYAILGLLLFLFSSVILWTINPNFFVFE
jgi:hypothetical protein